jgi:hypothetical protein
MKSFRRTTRVIITLLVLIVALSYCTKNDQVLSPGTSSASSSDLLSYKTTVPPNIDGTIDAIWDKAAKLNVVPQVPDPGNGLFAGYIGQTYPATLRSMYDDKYIYFLAEWADADKSVALATWYFNPAANTSGKTGWAQEPGSKTFDANGVLTRDGTGEDKLAMLWNIDNSTPNLLRRPVMQAAMYLIPI